MPDATPPLERTTTKATHRRSPWRWLGLSGAVLGVLVLVLAGLALIVLKTEWGGRNIWQLATRTLPDRLSGEFAGGTLADGVRLHNLLYRDKQRVVKIDRVNAEWDLSVSPLKLSVELLQIGNVDVTLLPSPKPPEPLTLPQEITLPLAIDLQQATVERVVIHQEDAATTFSNIRLAASSDGVNHMLQLQNAVTPWGATQASLQLNGRRPFGLAGTALLNGAWRDENYRFQARLSGSLQAPNVQLDISGDKLIGTALIEATPFATVPFQRARMNLQHVNPQMFSPEAPRADLRVEAEVKPEPSAAQVPADLSQFAVVGPVLVVNAQPGPIDKGLLPLVSVRVHVRMDTQQQQLSQLEIALAGDATLKGSGQMQGPDQGRLLLQANGLDLHALHTALWPTQLNGPLTVQLAQDTQHIELKLAEPTFKVEADARITPLKIEVNTVQLQSGQARLHASGKLARDGQSIYSVQGELVDFNPAEFHSMMRLAEPIGSGTSPPRIPKARINMDFAAHGALKPQPSADVEFNVRNSTYENLPMTGSGTLRVVGKRILSSDMQLAIAGNQLKVNGGFGSPPARLDFAIDAPALGRLGFGLSGLLQADGQLSGSVERPVVNAKVRAEQLVFGQYRVVSLSGEVHTTGVPGTAPNARVALDLRAHGLRTDQFQLRQLNADIKGTYGSHTISANAAGQLRGKALNLTLAAQGQLEERQSGLAWNGMLHTLENRGFPRFSIGNPLALSIAPGQAEVGATRMAIEQAVIDLGGFRYREDGPIYTAGAFRSLDVAHLFELRRQFTGTTAPFSTDLVLDGQWNLTLGDSADGFFRIERQRGDIAVLTGYSQSSLGLTDMWLRGEFDNRLIKLDARTEANRIGVVTAQGSIGLQPSGGRLVVQADSSVSGRVHATIPHLQSIAALAGPRISLGGSVEMDAAIDGTLADPMLSGEAAGNQLALVLFDQGVRLRDGIARIRVDNNVVELRQLEFHGGDGTLHAAGHIPLDESRSSALTATIVADNLQLLVDPKASLTVSGSANVANVNAQLVVTGKFVVDQALFSLPEKSGPKLSDDVVIYHDGTLPKVQAFGTRADEKETSPFIPAINVQVDLGDNFRFEGSGADLRLAGTLDIRSAPGQPPQAFGTVRIVEGTYGAFGAALEIERGVLNFQGSFTNPNVNILAMRRGQDVGAGVQVTGTVQQPRVALVSEPDVPEEEKLSWLVFGRGGGSAAPGQAESVARNAAVGLLNKFGAGRIAEGIGLDRLSIGESEFGLGDEQVVSLGKEISNRLYIGYEQSLAGAANVFKLTYDLTRHWSVVVRGGEIAGLEIFYSNRFDSIGGD